MSTTNAYVNPSICVQPTSTGPLDSLKFAVKDVFEIDGVTSSAGNPDWLRTHKAATSHAPSIERLLQAGATLAGTTHTDELMYSLNGENAHYGTPLNPKKPGHIPGGSSSGSASAAAAGDVHFSVGTDTGGSVRIPAAYCGLYGFRPTHDVISIDGVIPLAKSFDTVGWMAQEIQTMVQVGEVLLQANDEAKEPFTSILIPNEAWALIEEESVEALQGALETLKLKIERSETLSITKDGLNEWRETFRIAQAFEAWQAHGEWITNTNPAFGPGIAERFKMAASISEKHYQKALQEQTTIIEHMATILPAHTLMVIPTVPGSAHLVNLAEEQIEQRRTRTLQLSCIAGLAGLPQLTIPIDSKNGPIGLSLIAGVNQDLKLLSFGQRFFQT
ncbi:amidase [Alkalicoccobacillus gibsonii]|uniref:amidase n=1 Tax=Alkalicoccobacillus gibsonii TaxID=79881 RepID=UPI003F7B6E46